MKTKIIQITPAPAGMTAYFETDYRDDQGRVRADGRLVSCLALVETTDSTGTYTEVRAMIPEDSCDTLVFAAEHSGFIAVAHC